MSYEGWVRIHKLIFWVQQVDRCLFLCLEQTYSTVTLCISNCENDLIHILICSQQPDASRYILSSQRIDIIKFYLDEL